MTASQGKYVEVLGGHDDLKEAIYTKGPMTVSVDASAEAFRFYKSGVFDYAQCAAVLACVSSCQDIKGLDKVKAKETSPGLHDGLRGRVCRGFALLQVRHL